MDKNLSKQPLWNECYMDRPIVILVIRNLSLNSGTHVLLKLDCTCLNLKHTAQRGWQKVIFEIRNPALSNYSLPRRDFKVSKVVPNSARVSSWSTLLKKDIKNFLDGGFNRESLVKKKIKIDKVIWILLKPCPFEYLNFSKISKY